MLATNIVSIIFNSSDCAVKTPKPQAEDDEAARRLWEVSEQLVGLKKKA